MAGTPYQRQFYMNQPPTTPTSSGYTAPNNNGAVQSPYSTAIIKEIDVCNTTANTVNYSIFIVPNGGTAGIANAIAYQTTIAGNTVYYEANLNIMVPANATIYVAQGTLNAVTITINGVEVQ